MRVGRRGTHPCDKADDVNLPANARRIDGLDDRSGTADLNDVVDTASVRELEHLLVPIWRLLVVDDVRGPEGLEVVGVLQRRCRDDRRETLQLSDLDGWMTLVGLSS